MGVSWSQFFPPKPTLTEANLPSQKGKVCIVTGGYSSVGLELCTILYQADGKVYLAVGGISPCHLIVEQVQLRSTHLHSPACRPKHVSRTAYSEETGS
jgi:NAD(P)-dependent dehydrogenase (short-subunit alcohol dehydrogenase family)